MPAARAIRYKSDLAPATRFVLSASLPAEATAQAGIPIAFASVAATHIVRPHMQSSHQSLPISVAAPVMW